MRRITVHRSQRRRGAAMIEFAMILPWFLLLLFGLIEVGRLMMVYQTVVNAARESARVAALTTTRSEQYVTDTARDWLKQGVITSTVADSTTLVTVTVVPVPSASVEPNTPMTVTVTIPNYLEAASWVPMVDLAGIRTLQTAQISSSVTRYRQ